jgi:hypothetical protein
VPGVTDPLTDPTRVVVVTSGFGLWNAGRHVMSARWTDVARIRVRGAVPPASGVVLVVTQRNGAEIELPSTLTGWEAFVDAAPAMLPGMRPAATAPRDPEGIVLFERASR